MLIKSEKDFFVQIKSENRIGLYLIMGNDEYLKNKCIHKLIKKVSPITFTEFNACYFDGQDLPIYDVIDSVQTLPMGSPTKMIVINDLDIAKCSAYDVDQLLETISTPSQECTLIITIQNYEFDFKKSKAKKIYECVDKQGIVLNLTKNNSRYLVGEIQKLFEKKELKIDAKTAEFLATYCENDMLFISNEIDKLACYKTDAIVTKQDVIESCYILVQANIFELPKMIVQSNYNAAIHLVGNLFYQKEPATVMVSTIAAVFMDLYRAKLGKIQGLFAQDIANDFLYKNRAFLVGNALRDQSKFSIAFLRECLKIVADADETLKSLSGADDKTIIEQTITKIFLAYETIK